MLVKLILPLRAYALTLLPIGFALRSVQTHISMRNCFEMCVCTLLNANPMGGRLRAYAVKGKKTASVKCWTFIKELKLVGLNFFSEKE